MSKTNKNYYDKFDNFNDEEELYGYEVKNIRRQSKKKVKKFKDYNEYDDWRDNGILVRRSDST